MTAADILYGRRGGHWTDHTAAADALATIDRLRTRMTAEGTWPTSMPGPADLPWDGQARMARARADAGLPLSDRDVEALKRCGDA